MPFRAGGYRYLVSPSTSCGPLRSEACSVAVCRIFGRFLLLLLDREFYFALFCWPLATILGRFDRSFTSGRTVCRTGVLIIFICLLNNPPERYGRLADVEAERIEAICDVQANKFAKTVLFYFWTIWRSEEQLKKQWLNHIKNWLSRGFSNKYKEYFITITDIFKTVQTPFKNPQAVMCQSSKSGNASRDRVNPFLFR